MVPGPSAPTPSRRFDPSEHRRYLDLPGGPEWYNGRDKIYQLQSRDQDTGIIKVETDTAVIKISAGLTFEGNNRRVAWAIYVGEGNTMAGMLEDDAPSTTARGVLEGLAQALTLIKDMAADNPTLKNFKIQMHYPFVLRNMADRLDTIIARGGRLETCRVAHFECYRSLYGPLTNLEKTGIQIQFWNNHAYNARNVAKLCLKENSQASSQQG